VANETARNIDDALQLIDRHWRSSVSPGSMIRDRDGGARAQAPEAPADITVRR
jgi:hypothetical protein